MNFSSFIILSIYSISLILISSLIDVHYSYRLLGFVNSFNVSVYVIVAIFIIRIVSILVAIISITFICLMLILISLVCLTFGYSSSISIMTLSICYFLYSIIICIFIIILFMHFLLNSIVIISCFAVIIFVIIAFVIYLFLIFLFILFIALIILFFYFISSSCHSIMISISSLISIFH